MIALITQEEYGDDLHTGVSRPIKMTLMVAADLFPDDVVDIRTLDSVNDGTTTWHICKMLPVMPGVTPLIYNSDLEG